MNEPRLRQIPAERFAGPEHFFDLTTVTERLRSEPHAATDGHRQITIYHDGTTALVLLDFGAGAKLVDHTVDGLVTIHVLTGRVVVRTPDSTHDLGAAGLVVLAPLVAHDLHALEPSQVLLTVHLQASDES